MEFALFGCFLTFPYLRPYCFLIICLTLVIDGVNPCYSSTFLMTFEAEFIKSPLISISSTEFMTSSLIFCFIWFLTTIFLKCWGSFFCLNINLVTSYYVTQNLSAASWCDILSTLTEWTISSLSSRLTSQQFFLNFFLPLFSY